MTCPSTSARASGRSASIPPRRGHAGYAVRLGLNFPLLSDPELAVARAYGALRPDGRSIARSVVVVGQDGIIRYSQAGAPGAEIVLESLR
jgi:peroxiredoxin